MQIDVKETKEALVGVLKLAQLLAASFKDGVQASDFTVVAAKIMADEALKAALMEAYNGADKIPSEVGNMQLGEGVELLQAAIPEVLNLIKALKA